jgi:hypothetical protein
LIRLQAIAKAPLVAKALVAYYRKLVDGVVFSALPTKF